MVHAALKSDKSCSSCHSPHASANQKLLLQPEMEVCLGCHPAVVTRDMTVLHGPINDGNCTACHTPHGGRHARLLVDEFPQGSYVPYTDTAFPLCFRCHDRDLVREPKTSSATGFRDGEGNLHYLHMSQEQKGQSCRLCHVFHGGKGRHLLAASVPLGELSLPLQFEATPDGGRCTPGCHEPQSYRR
jgi:predicted CXXCH cytochrome family protein